MPLIALGSGPYAATLIDMFEEDGVELPYELAGFAQNVDPDARGAKVEGYPVYTLEELKSLRVTHRAFCILGDPAAKRKFVEQVSEIGFKFATIIHPRSRHSKKCEVGEGTMIGTFAMTFRHAKIGKHCTVLGQSIVGDRNELGDYVFLAAGAKLSGEVKVGSNTFFGPGSIVTERLTIGSNVIVGAGAVVIRDVPDNAVVVGNPAREIPRKGLFKPRPTDA